MSYDYSEYALWRENLDHALYAYFGISNFYDEDVGDLYGLDLHRLYEDGVSHEEIIRIIDEEIIYEESSY